MSGQRQNAGYVKAILRFVRPWRGRYAFGLITEAAGGYLTSLMLGTYVGTMLELAQAGSVRGVLQGSAVWLLGMAAFVALFALARIAFQDAALRAESGVREALYAHLLRQPYSVTGGVHSGELLSRLDSDVGKCRNILQKLLPDLLSTILTFILALLTLGALSWQIALALVGVGVVMFSINFFLVRRTRTLYSLRQEQTGSTIALMGDLLAGAEVVRIYGEDTGLRQRFVDACRQLFRRSMAVLNINSAYYGLNQVNAGLTIACSVGIGLMLYRAGNISIGALPLLIQMGGMVVKPISGLSWLLVDLNEGLAGAERVVGILNQPEEPITSITAADRLPASDIRADGLRFAYGDGRAALRDVAFDIPAGGLVGLVGYSGSGKSTLLQVLMGIQPYEGSLTIGGREVRDIPLDCLRQSIAYVPQSCPLFDGTVLDNIRLGDPMASVAEALDAARAAGVEEFVGNLPDGYMTQVGEAGAQLSGGQRQRIAVARAILKDANVLLLDEVTASLDSDAERQIMDSLQALMRGRTTLVVAHRLSTIQNAALILVFDQGRIVERGTHAALLRADGIYTRLHALQMSIRKEG